MARAAGCAARRCFHSEPGGGSVQETFYTLNLSNAKRYFTEQVSELFAQTGIAGLQDVYKKLTKRFLFNEYIITDEFDVFVAFETMNNREISPAGFAVAEPFVNSLSGVGRR